MNSSPRFAVITGAGSGIGKHVAIALAQEGYSVALAGRRKELLEATALAVGRPNSQTLVIPTDVSDAASVRELFAKTKMRSDDCERLGVEVRHVHRVADRAFQQHGADRLRYFNADALLRFRRRCAQMRRQNNIGRIAQSLIGNCF